MKGLGLERNVLVLGLSSSIASFGNLLWFFFLPILLEEQGFSSLEIALVYTFYSMIGMGVQLPIGHYLVDGLGRKKTIVLGGLISTTSLAVLALSTNPVLTASAFIIWGAFGQSLSSLARDALIMDSVPKERLATGFGTFITLAGSVAIVSPLIGGFFIAQRKQTAIFLTSMIMTLVMTVARSRFLEEKSSMLRSRREQNSFKGSLGKIIQTKPLLALTFAYAFYNLFLSQSGSSFNYVVALYSADVLHLSQLYIGIMFSLLTLIVTQLALPFGKLADRFGKKNIIIASWATEMVFMMFFAYSFGPLFALVSFSLWVGFGAMDGPALDALLGDFTTEENRGISLGFFNTFASALNVPAIFLVGVLFSFNPIFPFYANLAIGLFAFGFFLYYFAFSKI